MQDTKIRKPLISIVIPVYNAANYIHETLESAASQTYSNLEIICVDDCSTDDSEQKISDFIANHKNVDIYYLKNAENVGACETRNRGISSAKGEFILPFDADDLLDLNYCEKAMIEFNRQKDLSVVYCKAQFFNNNQKWDWDLPKYNAHRMPFRNLVFSCGFFRKSDWESFGGYNSNMVYGFQDWDFWLNFVERKLKFYRIPEVLFFYRRQESETPTISTGLKDKRKRELMLEQIRKNHPSLYKPFFYRRLRAYLATVVSKLLNTSK